MTIKNKFKLIKNDIITSDNHEKKTMALLKKLLIEKDLTQQDLAKALHRDKTTISRWSNDSREINWENAVKIASVLKIHPVEIYQPSINVNLYLTCSWDGLTKEIPKKDQKKIKVPFEFYNPHVKAVQMDAPGTPADGEIWLFDLDKTKKINKNVLGKVCYITASASFKKANHHKLETSEVIGKTKVWHPLIAKIKGCGNGKICIVNSITDEFLNPLCEDLNYEDFEYAVPVKAKFDPELL